MIGGRAFLRVFLSSFLAFAAAAATAQDAKAEWKEGEVKLKADTPLGNGITAKAGVMKVWYLPGDERSQQKLASCVLAQEYALSNGMKAKAGSTISFWENGMYRSLRLAEDWKSPEGILLAGFSEVELWDNGAWMNYTPKNAFSPGTGLPMAMAGTRVGFHRNGALDYLSLAEDYVLPKGKLACKAETYLSFNEDGSLRSATPKNDFTLPNGMKLKAGRAATFSGTSILDGTLAEPFEVSKGMFVSGDISFYSDGKLNRAWLAKDYAWKPDGKREAVFAAGTSFVNDAKGEFLSGNLAKPYGCLPAGPSVTWVDLKHAFDPGYAYQEPDDEYEDEEYGY